MMVALSLLIFRKNANLWSASLVILREAISIILDHEIDPLSILVILLLQINFEQLMKEKVEISGKNLVIEIKRLNGKMLYKPIFCPDSYLKIFKIEKIEKNFGCLNALSKNLNF